MTAAVPLGALVGALVAGLLAGPIGRRGVLLAAAVLFVVGALWAALAGGVFSLTMARLVLGLAIGSAAMTAPLYIAECAPAAKRGTMVAAYQLAITLGILGAYFVDDVVIMLTPEDPSDLAVDVRDRPRPRRRPRGRDGDAHRHAALADAEGPPRGGTPRRR